MSQVENAADRVARWLLPRPARVTLVGGVARVTEAARAWAQRGAAVLADAPHDGGRWRVEEVTGAWCSADDREGQGYTLTVDADNAGEMRARIAARSMAGVRAARATLVQLVRVGDSGVGAGATGGIGRGEVPGVVIEDVPRFARRGVMLDISRCRVPRVEELFALIDGLALLKCNHLQLYVEHTFAYSFGEEVWRGWSPIMPEELRAIDAYCASRGVELAANQNCFGHLRQWLESPGFASLAETHGEWMFDVWPRSGAFSLCPTDPASIAFVRKMLEEMLACVRGGWVNIGCDETYDIAYGRSRDACTRDGREVVYARFVREIVEVARSLGKRSMFWGDVALSRPECLELIPRDAAVLAWGYEPGTKFGAWCEAAKRGGESVKDGVYVGPPREVWVCPGTSTWRAITGRTTERRGNMDDAAREGEAHGAAGILVCEWGDCGHWQQPSVTMRALADGMEAAWSGATRSAEEAGGAIGMHALGVADGHDAAALTRVMDALGDADRGLREVCGGLSRKDREGKALPNATAIWADLFQAWNAETAHAGSVARWEEAAARVEEAGKGLGVLRLGSSRLRDEFTQTVALARWACARALARRGAGEWEDPGSARDALKAEHARLWRLGSREGGLAQSLEFFDRIDLGASPTMIR